MNLEAKFNELLKRYPSLFQYSKKIEVIEQPKTSKIKEVEFELFNSKRRYSYPFYKPISRIISITERNDDL